MTAGALDGRVALVTGAGRLRGIGRATAVGLAQLGADVVVTGTGRDPATYPDDEKKAGWRDVESTAEQIRATGRKAMTWTGDVSQAGAVDRLVDQVMNTFGRLDVLVNNAAYPRGNDRVPLPELDEAVWRKVLEIKLTGAFLLCKRIVPIMIKPEVGAHHQPVLDRGQARRSEHRRLQRGELRHPGPHAVAGHGGRAPRRHRQRGVPRHHRHRQDGCSRAG